MSYSGYSSYNQYLKCCKPVGATGPTGPKGDPGHTPGQGVDLSMNNFGIVDVSFIQLNPSDLSAGSPIPAGILVYDSGSNKLVFSTGISWETITST